MDFTDKRLKMLLFTFISHQHEYY